MTFSKKLISAVLAALMLAVPASAGPWDSWDSYDTIYTRGHWNLDLNNNTDGSQACESRTVNNKDYVFSIFTLSYGDYVIQFENPDWEFGTEELNQDFVIEIDRRGPWNISGNKWSNRIRTVVVPPSDGLSRFFTEVARGNTLYLRNDRGNEIARFSLSGTSRTLDQHRQCERRIFNGTFRSNDPFG